MEPPLFYTVVLISLVVGAVILAAVKIARRNKADFVRVDRTSKALLKHHSDMVAITDETGVIVTASELFDDFFHQANLNKATPSFLELFESKNQHDYIKILKYLRREKKPLVNYNVHLKVGELEREVDLTVVPVLDSSRQILCFIHILRPARQKGELASDLGHIEKLTNIGQIAAGMAHELNTPLGSIILSTDIIMEQLGNSGSVADEVSKIRAQADHCSKVVKQLLSYVRKDEHVRSQQDIRTVIEKVKELVAAETKTRLISIDVIAAPDRSVILCNENQIEQLFFNLVSNAFHAIDRDGRIVIQIGRDALLKQVTVSIADNGRGIPDDQIEKIFDPFFTTRSGKEGTGLGLALCKKIMLEHSGRITVESTVGQGTTFKLYFPIVE